MIKLEINNQSVTAKKGQTILEVLNEIGIKVPTLCHMQDLFPSGACRMCVVEIEGVNGLVPSCAYPIAEGMKIQTHSPRALRARKTIVELLLSNHPDDCLYCVRNGNCELQSLAEELGVRQRRYQGERNTYKIDTSSPSIIRDPDKCILCGKCVRVCEEVQGVSAIDFINRGSQTIVGTAFDEGLNISSCINCGQCVNVCPTGALREKSQIKEVMNALMDPNKYVIVQHAPAVSVTLGEFFDLKPGQDVMATMTAAFKKMGFKRVFDTSFTADLTIMEEASELVHRVTNNLPLPMFTSCSPGWIKFVEQFYPEFLDNVSSCKSPQQMMGAIIKHYYAEKNGIDPKNIYSVSIMPCTAKKFEAERPEFSDGQIADIDAVLTTRELARIIKMNGLDLKNLQPETADVPFGKRSSAGKLFGASGGVMEAAVRTAYYMLNGHNLEELKIQNLRGTQGRKEMVLEIGDLKVGVAVVSGLGNARELLDEIKNGRDDLHFIEVMTCPGGCINGGGQPIGLDMDAVKARMKTLYQIDRDETLRLSHENEDVKHLYEEFLGEPLGEKSHHLLHTKYVKREVTF